MAYGHTIFPWSFFSRFSKKHNYFGSSESVGSYLLSWAVRNKSSQVGEVCLAHGQQPAVDFDAEEQRDMLD